MSNTNSYTSTYTGAQMDSAFERALNPDNVAVQNSTRPFQSGAAYTKFASLDASIASLLSSVSDLEDISIIVGSVAPSSATEGQVGQFYLDSIGLRLYVCTSTLTGYSWLPIPIGVSVPTKTSDLTNDSGFVSNDDATTGQVLRQGATDAEWQSVDSTPTQSSGNLITSGGVKTVTDALTERITNLEGIGRFYSLWDCTTGKPTTNPSVMPYNYTTGGYFIVKKVGYGYKHSIHMVYSGGDSYADFAVYSDSDTPFTDSATLGAYINGVTYPATGVWGTAESTVSAICVSEFVPESPTQSALTVTCVERSYYTAYNVTITDTVTNAVNYRPTGSSYNNVASTTVESVYVKVGDVYYFDGSGWALQSNNAKGAIASTLTISVADWNGGTTATKTVPYVTASNVVIIDPSDPSIECTGQATNQLTFTAMATPEEAITVKVVILE